MLTIEELGRELSVSRSTLVRWMKKGMPFGYHGLQKKVFDLESVRNWLVKEQEKLKETDHFQEAK